MTDTSNSEGSNYFCFCIESDVNVGGWPPHASLRYVCNMRAPLPTSTGPESIALFMGQDVKATDEKR